MLTNSQVLAQLNRILRGSIQQSGDLSLEIPGIILPTVEAIFPLGEFVGSPTIRNGTSRIYTLSVATANQPATTSQVAQFERGLWRITVSLTVVANYAASAAVSDSVQVSVDPIGGISVADLLFCPVINGGFSVSQKFQIGFPVDDRTIQLAVSGNIVGQQKYTSVALYAERMM